MAKKKKKKAVKKKNVNSNKKKNTSKKKSTVNSKTNIKKVNGTSKNTFKKSNVAKNTTVKNVNLKKSTVVDKKTKDTKSIVVKTSDNKKTKVNKLVLVISFVILVLCIVGIVIFANNVNNRVSNEMFVNINFDEYLDLYDKEGLEFIYLYHSSCVNCDSYEDNLIKLEKEFEIRIKKFDYSKLNNNEISILKSSNSFLDDDIEIPIILSIKDGNEISSISGIKEYSALKNFVNLSKSENGINNFNKISVDDYLSILGSKEKSIIYICDSSDGCSKFSSVLDKVSSDRKIKINYLNTENIVSSSDWKSLEESNKIFKKMWFMPVVMIVKDDKIIDYKMETLSEKDLNKFFKKNGM